MNRIYQGRTTSLELLAEKDAKGQTETLREYNRVEADQVLWDFHALFQDAVNYYLICLMALAHSPDSPVTKIRARADGRDPEHNIWESFRRKGNKRQGMRLVARHFGLDPETASLEDCCSKALEGNHSSPELLDDALQELLSYCSGDSKIQQEGRAMLPRFCNPRFAGNYPRGAAAELRKRGEEVLSTELHCVKDDEELHAFVERMQLGWVVNISKRGKPADGEQARKRLHKAVAHFGQCYGTHRSTTSMGKRVAEFLHQHPGFETLLQDLDKKIAALSNEALPTLPPVERTIPDRVDAFLLLKHLPCRELVELLKVSFPLKESKSREKDTSNCFGGDPIELARGKRGYVFPAFTALELFGAPQDKTPQWIEFDIAAFKEALKAFHQLEQKEEDRVKERRRLMKLMEHMDNGKGSFTKEDLNDESFEPPPILCGDPRIERIREIHDELKRPSDLAASDEDSSYGLEPRTIRGFEKLAGKWGRLKPDDPSMRKDLKEALTELQTEVSTTIGSVELFEKLMEPHNWTVWRDAFDQTPPDYLDHGWARNPLEAYVQRLLFAEEAERLKEPIRFTPADPQYSRRQYCFGDKQFFKAKGLYRHEPNELAVIVPIAVFENGAWRKRRVRLHYSAPRLLRDGLRGDDEDLTRMPWLQPMMKALGLDTSFPQDVHNYPVFLMPDRSRDGAIRTYLNFPLTLDEEKRIAKALGKADRWARQFAGTKEKNLYLKWPDDIAATKTKGAAWYEKPAPFRVLAVDLGVRNAGAVALLECRADNRPAPKRDGTPRHSRQVGSAGGHEWRAAVIHTGLLRLPGEDAKVWRDGAWQQELSGERGRKASQSETDEAKEVLASLGYAQLWSDLPSEGRFLADQNERLLLAFRWAQKRLRTWQSWSWMLSTKDKCEQAQEGIRNARPLPAAIESFIAKEAWPLVRDALLREIDTLRACLVQEIVRIANRVVPLRGRGWQWARRDDEAGYVLIQAPRGSEAHKRLIAGQRGLSIERIELIEDLRKRCQSLNKALLQTPGQKPVLGSRTKGREAPDPCPDLLDKLERLREQRVNQTAHLILAEALGVRLAPHRKPASDRKSKSIHGEYERHREPVDFIVLEDLNRYLTSQGRSRAENSRLMKWCHRAILAKLKQLCEAYGIPVVEASAAYSSRFSAKDGTPGFRAVEVRFADRHLFPWRRMLEKGETDAVKLFQMLETLDGSGNRARPLKLLAPMGGGPIFVPMKGPEAHADINAAINLALRALAAPGMLDIHHRIRTEKSADNELRPLARSKREQARWGKAPTPFTFSEGTRLERNSNCFAIAGFRPDFETCVRNGIRFATGKGLWSSVKQQQWKKVNEINAARISRWQRDGRLPPEDNIPM